MEKLIASQYDLATDDGILHYDIYGRGPACIVLSGGPGLDSRYLGNLGGIEDTVTFILLHPRGSGLSTHPDQSDWSLGAYARDVEAVRSHLGLRRPLVLGHSHGGFIALQYALDYPQAAGGLILVGTSSCMATWDPEAAVRPYADEPWFPEAYEAMKREPTNEEDTKADLLTMMPFYFAHTGPDLEAVKDNIAPYRMSIVPKFDFATYDLRTSLLTIQAPTLILAGRQDWICTAQMSEEMARLIPGARLIVFEECGHFPWMEARDRFRSAVHDFVGGLALENQ
jgi:pimeloyl-ACP methyl ester carboxylesterase